ncbi:MAG: hypothetical protein AMXMBFR83_26160 [Phycisphaerae bacterium]
MECILKPVWDRLPASRLTGFQDALRWAIGARILPASPPSPEAMPHHVPDPGGARSPEDPAPPKRATPPATARETRAAVANGAMVNRNAIGLTD